MIFSTENIINHPIQLKRVNLTNLKVDKILNVEEVGDVERNITVSTRSSSENVINGTIEVTLSVEATLETKKYYSIAITYQGDCENSMPNITQKEYDYFLEVQAIRMIWPYFRETLPSLLYRMGAEPFQLPTIDVLNTIASTLDAKRENE